MLRIQGEEATASPIAVMGARTAMAKKLNKPYLDLLPPLSTEEFKALEASIKAEGVREPIVIDEDGNILDGHHRYAICPTAKTRIIKGLTEAEKRAYVLQSNFIRRNLSPAQKVAMRMEMKKVAIALKTENPKKYTQAVIAKLLGVARTTVEEWFRKERTTNDKFVDTCKDAKVKIQPKAKPIIFNRIESGESQRQIAADYGVTQQQISRIITAEKKVEAKKKKVQESIKRLGGDIVGIHHGDFREIGKDIPDESVDLIFTDPPYDEESVPLYGDLAALAARILRPGGWCLAYSGQWFLMDVLNKMREQLTYGWLYAIGHSGGDLRFRKYKLQNKFKPVVGFYKSPLNCWWDWFPDMVSGGKEKSDHPWQQALLEAEHFIKALSPEGGVICDPMCGSGTTYLAAKQTNRQWIGIELEKKHVETARSGLHDAGFGIRGEMKCPEYY